MMFDRIVCNSAILGGKPCVKGTRISVEFLLELVASGAARAASVFAETDCILLKISATLLDKSPETIQLKFLKNFAMTLLGRLSKSMNQEG